jgi:hypothetical protein
MPLSCSTASPVVTFQQISQSGSTEVSSMSITSPAVPPARALKQAPSGVAILLLFMSLAGLLVYARLTNPAFGAQSDLPFHYHFTRAYQQSLAEGNWLPHWAGLLDGGRGEALFTFYPPLCFWLTAGLARLFGTDLINGLKLTTFLCLTLAQGSVYLFARAFLDRKLSVLAAAIFICLPGYALITLNRALLPNGLALCFVPLVLLAAHNLLLGDELDRDHPWAALFAFGLSAIVLTHVVTTYVCALALGLMTLCYLPAVGWRGGRNLFLAGLIALALTAFFLLPQQLEIHWVNVKVLTEQHDFRSYFLFAPPRSSDAYHQAWAGLNGAASWITVLQTLLTVLTGVLLWRKPLAQSQRLLLRFSLTLTGFCLLISLPVSRPLWEWLPGLSYLQFPWRMQPLVALSGGLLLALLGARAWELDAARRKTLLTFPTLLLLANLFFTYATTRPPKQELSHTQVLQALNAFELPPTTTEALREAQTKEGAEYLAYFGNQLSYRPRGTETRLYSTAASYGGLTFISGRGEIREQQLANQRRAFQLRNAEPVRVRLETYAYPHWIARLDEQEVPVQVEPGSGLMLLDVPAGEHRLTFSYEIRQPVIIWARRFSALAWVLFAIWLGWLGFARLYSPKQAQAHNAPA